MKILGVSALYHDSAAALIVDGTIVAAVQEERFTRKKFDASFPQHSIKYCLNKAGLKLSDIDEVVYYEKPFPSFERLLESIIATAPQSYFLFLASMPIWLREKLNTRKTITQKLKKIFPHQKVPPILFSEHHLSHAASAFYPSPFQEAAILCLDGVGEWATTSAWIGKGQNVEPLWEIHFPHSVGLLYSAFTHFCGFKVNSGEYKLMGLAPYGEPRYVDLIKKHLIEIKDDGSYNLNLDYFSFVGKMQMTNEKFATLFGVRPRSAEGPMPQIYKDLAASIQKVTEEVILKLAKTLRVQGGVKNLCLAGGVALNCVANGLLHREGLFENIWVQPAAGDAGGALGAALAAYHLHHQYGRTVLHPDAMKGAFLGPQYSESEIEAVFLKHKVHYKKLSRQDLVEKAVKDLQEQKVVGWFQGASEYGPRALGARSILGDARSPLMQSRMNQKIKFRESFRPFAPIVLAEKVNNFFESSHSSPYMLFTMQIKEAFRQDFPAVVHVDGSARVQTVTEDENPLLHQLLREFENQTGAPILVNTSFNVRGEPIVETPFDALKCFVLTDMDSLVVGPFFLEKEAQSFSKNDAIWGSKYEMD